MSKTVFVFPGQGAQFSGMGKELYDSSQAAKNVFEKAESLKKGIMQMCFNGDILDLSLTVNTQPCIFTVSMAAAASYTEKGITADIVAGFSSGELAALTYAGVFSFEDGFNAVLKRAQLMHDTAIQTDGGMAAVLRLQSDKVQQLASKCGVFAVNFNCPMQTVVAGKTDKLATFCDEVLSSGGRLMPLKVSGAFHSPYMQQAGKEFKNYLSGLNVNPPLIKVYSNLTANPYLLDKEENLNLLSQQIYNPVLWEKTIKNILAIDDCEFLEMQPGNVLTGLINKIKQSIST